METLSKEILNYANDNQRRRYYGNREAVKTLKAELLNLEAETIKHEIAVSNGTPQSRHHVDSRTDDQINAQIFGELEEFTNETKETLTAGLEFYSEICQEITAEAIPNTLNHNPQDYSAEIIISVSGGLVQYVTGPYTYKVIDHDNLENGYCPICGEETVKTYYRQPPERKYRQAIDYCTNCEAHDLDNINTDDYTQPANPGPMKPEKETMKPKDRKDTQRAALELIILAAAALTMLIIVLKFIAVVIL